MDNRNQMRGTDQGFTLMEMLVAMAMSGLVMASIYMTYYSQQRSYILQEQVAAMQQNHRCATTCFQVMYLMAAHLKLQAFYSGICALSISLFHCVTPRFERK